jgi:hypothetical protein
MHSSQMNTDGPAMSFFTSCWLLPQKEQYRTFSPEAPFLSAMGMHAVQARLVSAKDHSACPQGGFAAKCGLFPAQPVRGIAQPRFSNTLSMSP